MSRSAKPITAYLVDKNGTVHSTYEIYDKDPQLGIAGMNSLCLVVNEGRLCWTLDQNDRSALERFAAEKKQA